MRSPLKTFEDAIETVERSKKEHKMCHVIHFWLKQESGYDHFWVFSHCQFFHFFPSEVWKKNFNDIFSSSGFWAGGNADKTFRGTRAGF